MKEYKVIGIDLANNVFQVAALNQANRVDFNKKVSRRKLVQTIQQLPPSMIAVEVQTIGHASSPIWGTRSAWFRHSM